MAKKIVWDRLTLEETETLTALENSGKEVYAAPMEIEHKDQLRALGLTWDDCKTWYIGSERVTVHLTPADKATYDMLLGDLRAKHRDAYRKRRCPIPGKLKPTIMCPECNKCSECPFPEYRDKHKASTLSWEKLTEDAYEGDGQDVEVYEDPEFHQIEVKMELEAVLKVIDTANPKYTKALILREYYGMSVANIAKKMHDSERNVYYYISEAKKIGAKYKKENY